jgi:hypothetical protein
MVGPDSLPLQVAWKLLTQPQRLTKEQLLTFISRWEPRTVEQMSDLTTTYLPWSQQQHSSETQRTFSHTVSFLVLFQQFSLISVPSLYLAVGSSSLGGDPSPGSLSQIKSVLMLNPLPPFLLFLFSV